MNPMREHRDAAIEGLRRAIDCMPRETRVAMLQGVEANDIIIGGYASQDGVCPMLAAHRAGGRTCLISFANAWDRLALPDARERQARRASARELRILTTNLHASLLADEAPATRFPAAIAEHRELIVGRGRSARASRRRPGDPDRARELRNRPGWAWMRVVRRYDDYERLREELRVERESIEVEREPAGRVA